MKIKFISCFNDPTGYAETARQDLIALQTTKIKITTDIVQYTNDQSELESPGAKLARKFQDKYKDFDKVLIELTPEMMWAKLEPAKYNIGTMFWEVIGLDKRWVWYINKLDELWLSSPMFIKNFKECGVKIPIHFVPHAIDTSKTKYKPFKIPKARGYKFYSIFQWTERKNPQDLIKIFWKTFTGKDDVCLIIHTYRGNFSPEEQSAIKRDILRWKSETKLKHYPRVLIHLEPLTHEEIMRLHSSCDCYVSPHRGEGWGLPAIEAMLVGNPAISTNFGGINELLEKAGARASLVDYKLTKVFGMNHIPWYNPTQKWADPDKKDLAKKMIEAYSNQEKWDNYGKYLQGWVIKNLNYKRVGKIMEGLLK